MEWNARMNVDQENSRNRNSICNLPSNSGKSHVEVFFPQCPCPFSGGHGEALI